MIFNDFLMFFSLLILCFSTEVVDIIDINIILQDYQYLDNQFDQSNTFSPKQTLTPITFAPTPSATSSNSTSVFASLEMIIFYIIFGIAAVFVIIGIVIYRCCKKKEIAMTINPNEINVIEELQQPLADNPNLPDEGLVQI